MTNYIYFVNHTFKHFIKSIYSVFKLQLFYLYTGSNLVKTMDESAVYGVVQNSGDIHLWSSCLGVGNEQIAAKEKYIVIADDMVHTSSSMFRQSDYHVMTAYRLKKPSQTRFYRRVEAYIEFMFNEARIYSVFQNKWPQNKAFQAYRKNRWNVQWVMVNVIKIEEVCF